MKRAATISLAISLALSFAASSVPAQAQGLLTDLVKDTLDITGGVINTTGNFITGTVDAAGNLVDASGRVVGRVVTDTTGVVVGTPSTTTQVVTIGPSTDVYRLTLDTRFSDLRSAILSAEASGKITAAQAIELRNELDRIAMAEANAKLSNGVLTFDESIAIARDLDLLNTRVGTTLSVSPFRPLLVTTNGVERMWVVAPRTGGVVTSFVDNPVGAAANIVKGTIDTTGNILDAAGKIVARVATGSTATPITSTPTSSVTDTRILTVGPQSEVYGRFISNRLTDLRNAVLEAQVARTIDNAQANAIILDLDKIASAQAAALVSGNTLSFDETISIARDIDRVNSNVSTLLNRTIFPSLVVTDASGNTRLSFASRTDTVISSGMPTTISGTTTIGTTPVVTTQITTTPEAWLSVLDARRFELDRLLGLAITDKRITVGEASDTINELNRLSSKIISIRRAKTPLTLTQAVTLAQEIDATNTRIASLLHTAPMPALTVIDNGSPRLVTDVFGNVVAMDRVGRETFITTFDARRSMLEQSIANALTNNQLTAQQAADLRADLNRIAQLEASSKGSSTAAYATMLPIAFDLDAVGSRIRTYVPGATYPQLVTGTRMMLDNGRMVMLDDVMVRRAEIENRINRELVLGRLTKTEASVLRGQLGTVVTLESRMRSDGVLTFSEVRQIFDGFDRIMSRLNSLVANRRTTIGVR